MSYLKRYEYLVVPKESYTVIRNCAKCGKKTEFINTCDFRVNANGNQVDVWLIYQCETCKHTYNLTIYERVKPTSIDKEEYERFLSNDKELAYEYGRDKAFFARNKAEIITSSMEYRLLKVGHECLGQAGKLIIQNPNGLKIRADKVLAELFGISRSAVKKRILDGWIKMEKNFITNKETEIPYVEPQETKKAV